MIMFMLGNLQYLCVTVSYFFFLRKESKYGVQDRNVQFVIKKKEEGPYWPQLLKGIKKVQ